MVSRKLTRREVVAGLVGAMTVGRPSRGRAGQEPHEFEEKVSRLVSDNKVVPSEWRREVRSAVDSIKGQSPEALKLVLQSLEADDQRLNAAGREAFVHARAKLLGEVQELIKERGRGLSHRDLEKVIGLASENAVYIGLIRQSTRVRQVNEVIKDAGVGEWVKHFANFGMLDQPFHNPFKTVYELAQKYKAYEKFTELDDNLFDFLDDLLKNKEGVQRRRLLRTEQRREHYIEHHLLNKDRTLEDALKDNSVKVGAFPYAIYHAQMVHMFGATTGVAWGPEIYPNQMPAPNRPFAFYYTDPARGFKVSTNWGVLDREMAEAHPASIIWLGAPRHLENTFSFPINTAFTPPKYLDDYAVPPATRTSIFHEPDRGKAIHVRALDITEKMPQVLPKGKIGYAEIKAESKPLSGFGLVLMRQRTADGKVEVYEPVHRVTLTGRSVKVPLGEVKGGEYRFVYLLPNGVERSRDRRLFQITGGKTTPVTLADRIIPDND